MSYFTSFISKIMGLLGVNFTLYGFTFSFWDILMFSMFATLAVWFIRRII